jgi:uncharacterized membrane protein YkoI
MAVLVRCSPILLALAGSPLLIIDGRVAHASSHTSIEMTESAHHDWARDAVRSGNLKPLVEILRRLEVEFLGQVIEIELARHRGRPVYEIDLLSPRGHMIELVYDATTGHLLQALGPDLDAARRQAPPLTRLFP